PIASYRSTGTTRECEQSPSTRSSSSWRRSGRADRRAAAPCFPPGEGSARARATPPASRGRVELRRGLRARRGHVAHEHEDVRLAGDLARAELTVLHEADVAGEGRRWRGAGTDYEALAQLRELRLEDAARRRDRA